MVAVTRAAAVGCQLGEGPVWSAAEAALYWTDIVAGRLHRLDAASGALSSLEVGVPVGSFALRRGGGFVLACAAGFARWAGPGAPLEPLGHPEAGRADARFNDGKVDAGGRFWAATLGPGFAGGLYRLDPDGAISRQLAGVGVGNGIGWSPDGQRCYFTDSRRGTIVACRFDVATGALGEPRLFAAVPAAEGVPDGLAVDDEGGVWSARWGGGEVVRYRPDGVLSERLALPVSHPTSCAFGGVDYNTLYITTARRPLSRHELARQPWAGDLLAARVGYRAGPAPLFAG